MMVRGSSEGHPQSAARHASRLAAVQAIYQMELTGADAESVAHEFIEHRFGPTREMGEPDEALFGAIVRGVPHHQSEIDRAITGSLASGWRLSRVDSILRAILRAAAFELVARKDIPARVVLDEYVEISHAFFGGDEPSFVNAALDKIARAKRAPEFSHKPPDDESEF
jgi:N utilization substance protein B